MSTLCPTTCAQIEGSLNIGSGVVYIGSEDNKLHAFDAAGTVKCSGTPKSCSLLWTAVDGTRKDRNTPGRRASWGCIDARFPGARGRNRPRRDVLPARARILVDR